MPPFWTEIPSLPEPALHHGERPLVRLRTLRTTHKHTFPRRYYARVARNTLG